MDRRTLEEQLYEKKMEYDNLLQKDVINENEKIQLEIVIQRLTRQLRNLENK